MKRLSEQSISFTRVTRIKDRVLLGELPFKAFFKLWYMYTDEQANSQWEQDSRNPNKAGEIEDGEYKVFVREPTRIRGESGHEKRASVGSSSDIAPGHEEHARKKLRIAGRNQRGGAAHILCMFCACPAHLGTSHTWESISIHNKSSYLWEVCHIWQDSRFPGRLSHMPADFP